MLKHLSKGSNFRLSYETIEDGLVGSSLFKVVSFGNGLKGRNWPAQSQIR